MKTTPDSADSSEPKTRTRAMVFSLGRDEYSARRFQWPKKYTADERATRDRELHRARKARQKRREKAKPTQWRHCGYLQPLKTPKGKPRPCGTCRAIAPWLT